MATRPATTPEAAPTEVAWPSRSFSTTSQPSIAAQVAAVVLIHTRAGVPSAASSEPALKPNQPNHSRPAPIIVSGTLCGRIATLPKPRRLPTTRARTRPAIPALMWTTVPPAKSIGATLATPSVTPKTSGGQAVLGAGEEAAAPDHVGDREVGEGHPQAGEDQPGRELDRSATAPLMRATVITAKVSWKPTNASSGMLP